MKAKKFFNFTPAHIITLSFLVIIVIGAFLLSLPISSKSGEGIRFIDALFTATSSVCVTGLVVVNTLNYWSVFGQVVILLLIQVGALGFMSLITLLLVFLGKKITLRDRILIQESFNLSNFKGMVLFIKSIVKGTLIIEGIGALILSLRFIPQFGFWQGAFKAIFISVSAFCNAGFDILGNNSLIEYKTDYLVNITIIVLIVLGGIGFSVWMEVKRYIKYIIDKLNKKEVSYFGMSVHSKLVICMTLFLILIGFVSTFLLEFNNPNTIGNLRLDQKILASLFQSVTLRTAGFDTIGQVNLSYGSKFLAIFLMAIGGSPGGTAGGIKTATVGAIIFSVLSIIKGRNQVIIFRRSISFNIVQKALSIVVMMIGLIFFSTVFLSISEKEILLKYEFIDLLYEATSALGTVGLSMGMTPMLSIFGKIIIISCMFIGRIGPITLGLALYFRRNANKNFIQYPEEKIIVG